MATAETVAPPDSEDNEDNDDIAANTAVADLRALAGPIPLITEITVLDPILPSIRADQRSAAPGSINFRTGAASIRDAANVYTLAIR